VINKYIQISDTAKEPIIDHIQESLSFIEDALKNPLNNVLVHCYYGVSRSAAIIIAFLMKKYSLSYQKAYER
jgi:dual specificity phosphatase 12